MKNLTNSQESILNKLLPKLIKTEPHEELLRVSILFREIKEIEKDGALFCFWIQFTKCSDEGALPFFLSAQTSHFAGFRTLLSLPVIQMARAGGSRNSAPREKESQRSPVFALQGMPPHSR